MSTTPPEYGPPSEYGPPTGYTPPAPPQYGPPPVQQYGPPPGYGQQYGPPAGQYGPPPGYGQPPAMGPVTTQFARIDPGPSQSFGVVGALIAVIGAVLAVVAFTAASWFSGDDGSGSSTYSNIHKALGLVPSLREPTANAYFAWLGWVLLVVAVVVALAANVPTIGAAFRVIAPVVALAAIVLTFLAIKLVKDSSQLAGDYQGYTSYLKHARAGFYFAVAGFLLIGIGALVGPRNRRG